MSDKFSCTIEEFDKGQTALAAKLDRRDAEIAQRRFKMIDPTDGSDVLGGPISLNNAYLSMYPNYDDRRADQLDHVGDRCWVTMNLSGGKGRYEIVRIK